MEKGDIIFLDYDAWMVDLATKKDELFDTTHEKKAKEAEIFNEKETYKPRPFIAGVEGGLKGLGEILLEAEVDKEYDIEIPPEKAYGESDSKKIEVHSRTEIVKLPEFKEAKEPMEPYPGMEINLKGKIGRITLVTAGRVRVDFNHRLAGLTLKYKYKITGVAKTPEEKVKAIIGLYYVQPDDFKVDVDGETAKVTLADICKYDPSWYSVKIRIVSDLREHAKLETVQFIEEYVRKKEATKDEEGHEHHDHEHGHEHKDEEKAAPKEDKTKGKKKKTE
jgi:FKBP-type peptidyl-prolyl cis-trans isomerase 2